MVRDVMPGVAIWRSRVASLAPDHERSLQYAKDQGFCTFETSRVHVILYHFDTIFCQSLNNYR